MWISVTKDLLISRVTEAERNVLATAAIADEQDPLAEIADSVVKEWRGGLRRVTPMATGNTLPEEILIHVLADFRYRACTRIPSAKALLSDERIAEWTRANTVRDNLKAIDFEQPTSEQAETSSSVSGHPGPAVADPATPTLL
jgi:hypothetical protein